MTETIKEKVQSTQKDIDQRLQEFKHAIKAEEWNSTEFLRQSIAEIKPVDEELAHKILSRVNDLNKLPRKNSASSLPVSKPQSKQVSVIQRQRNFPLISKLQKSKRLYKSSLFLLVVLPSILFAIYQLGFAAERFESRAQLIVQQPDGMATMDASMALLSGFGMSSPAATDAQLVKTYVYSKDMLDFLVKELNLTEHYLTQNNDIFSKLSKSYSQEDLLAFYQNMVKVDINTESSVISVATQAYTQKYAQELTEAIVKRAEWYINQIGNSLAAHQLDFVRGEHIKVEEKLSVAKNTLLSFQEQYNLLDPEAEGMALQQIAYGLEAKLVEKQSELNTVISIMNNNAPQVKALRSEIRALQNQLAKERARLSNNSNISGNGDKLSVSAILAKYAELKINLELALKAFASSEVSLEKARIETYRKLKYLVVVEAPTLPDTNKYPKTLYNITLFVLLSALLYGIGCLILSTVKEIK